MHGFPNLPLSHDITGQLSFRNSTSGQRWTKRRIKSFSPAFETKRSKWKFSCLSDHKKKQYLSQKRVFDFTLLGHIGHILLKTHCWFYCLFFCVWVLVPGQDPIAITARVGLLRLLYVLLRCAIYIYEQRVQTVINVTLVHATKCTTVNQR